MRRGIAWIGFGLFLASATAAGQTLNVSAAASLKEAVGQIAKAFEQRYPQIHVALNFGGSQQLAAQIRQGVPVDVFLSAGFEPLKGIEFDPESLRVFATNRLVLVVPAQSSKVKNLLDLGRSIRLVVADRRVPAGDYSLQMLANAGKVYGKAWERRVLKNVASREQDVRAVLAKVAIGEADAGIVYVSDVSAAKGLVWSFPISDGINVEARYPAVRFKDSANGGAARDFMRFIFESGPQKSLVNHGFGSPLVPSRPIQLTLSGRATSLDRTTIAKLPFISFSADEHGKTRQFKGFDLKPLLKGVKGKTIAVSGADEYRQTVERSTCLQNGIFLIETPHEGFQLILPNQPPKVWVHWVRSIEAG